MERIFKWPPPQTSDGGIKIGVFVERLSSGQPHCGFIRVEPDTTGYLLHLRDQVNLRDERARNGIVCIIVSVSPIRAEAIAQRAQAIATADKSRGIRFGLSSPDQDWFHAEGHAIYGNDHLGLTCSHFVLAFFRDVGLPLVQYETWPERAEDIEWQERFCRHALSGEAEQDKTALVRQEAMEKEIGSKRVRPLEVAGAALAEARDLPVEFSVANELSKKVEIIMLENPWYDGGAGI